MLFDVLGLCAQRIAKYFERAVSLQHNLQILQTVGASYIRHRQDRQVRKTDLTSKLDFPGNLCMAAFGILETFYFLFLPKLGGGVDHWPLSCFYDLFAQMWERGGANLAMSESIHPSNEG